MRTPTSHRDFIDYIRSRLKEPLDPRGLLAPRLAEFIDQARGKIQEKAGALGEDLTGRMLREWSNTARNIGHIGRILDACFVLNLQELAENVKGGPLHKALSALPRSAFMEPASPLVTGSRYSGTPVYFVNGIWTAQDKATEAAEQLADHLSRPVYLIYNPSVLDAPGFRTGTPGITGDLWEAAYDRVWPLVVCTMEPDQVVEARPGRVLVNSTSRRIAHIFYHASGPVSIVSHSQGCIIVRNACFALSILGKEKWVREKLAWVSAGTPLKRNEVWPTPDKYTSLVDKDDPVPRIMTFGEWGKIDISIVLFKHGFLRHYKSKIRPSMLWPA